ncbi:MAG: fructosamine kinase family protein [Alphaproteobacteria bacterium]
MIERLTKIAGEPIGPLHLVANNYGIAIYRAKTATKDWAIKHDTTHLDGAHLDGRLEVEARMLGDLARAAMPAPAVRHSAPDLLAMDWVPSDPQPDSAAVEAHAGELLARLHTAPAPGFGYPYDTTIGPLPQPNPVSQNWVDFFADHRLRPMAKLAAHQGALPENLALRLEKFTQNLARYLPEPVHPSLVHGDVWAGNVLAAGGRVAAFIDPALYHGDAEVELAYITMLETFGQRFFDVYHAHRAIDPEFFATRRDIYALYPRLVHVILCGAAYLPGIDDALRKFGF